MIEKLSPGTLNLVIEVLPRVISLSTVAELGSAVDPITILLSPVVKVSPVFQPIATLDAPEVISLQASLPTRVFFAPVVFKPASNPTATHPSFVVRAVKAL